MRIRSARAILLASVLVPLSAFAQYRVGTDGQALDANNRLGSNGYNANGAPLPYVNGNLVVTGNVTGGKEFRGGVPYAAPSAFRGTTGFEQTEQFIRDSNGVPTRGQVGQNYLNAPQPFYGAQTTVAAPPGYTLNPRTNSYVPEQMPLQQGAVDLNYNLPPSVTSQLPGPRDNALIGATGANGLPTYMMNNTPTYQVEPWQSNADQTQFFISRTAEVPLVTNQQQMTPEQIQQLRQQIAQQAATQGPGIQQANNLPNPNPPGTTANALNQPGSIVSSGGAEARQGTTPTPQPQTPGLLGQVPLNTTLATGQGSRNILLTPPERQSSQIDVLQQRMQKLLQEQSAQPGAQPSPGNVQVGPGPNEITINAPATQPAANSYVIPRGKAPEPMHISSLATGVKAESLANLLKQAEMQMRDGKYATASATYGTVLEAAPNNAMALLGRAHAELGGEFFTRANMDMHEALLAQPSLSLAQYDLKSLYGDQRLQKIIEDLKAAANANPQDSRPTFLLAYVAYNIGNEAKAADYLREADKRAGNNDAIIRLLQKTWKLPS